MHRLIQYFSYLLLLLSLAGVGFAANHLTQTLTAPPPAGPTALPAEELAAITPDNPQPPTPPNGPWPALFGEAPVIEPQPPAPVEPQPPAEPPAPPSPPLESLGYTLKGVLDSGTSRYAFISHPTGDFLLREGEELVEGIEVSKIEENAVRFETGRGEEWLRFEEETP